MFRHITSLIIIPLYFLLFLYIFKPEDMIMFLGCGQAVEDSHAILQGSIIAATVLLSRAGMTLYSRRKVIGVKTDLFWCFCEMAAYSAFIGMYISLFSNASFISCAIRAFTICFVILAPAYAIINLAFIVRKLRKSGSEIVEKDSNIRFYDEHKKLKMIISADAVIYIKADDNVLRINYLDSEKVKEYVLRASMKSIEPAVTDKGLVRCQRSYFVNPAYVRVLRKDSAGFLYADLSIDGLKPVPISKTYYDNLAAIL